MSKAYENIRDEKIIARMKNNIKDEMHFIISQTIMGVRNFHTGKEGVCSAAICEVTDTDDCIKVFVKIADDWGNKSVIEYDVSVLQDVNSKLHVLVKPPFAFPVEITQHSKKLIKDEIDTYIRIIAVNE